jgi:hypothetical protein
MSFLILVLFLHFIYVRLLLSCVCYELIGSTDLWLPSTDCTTSGCESQPQFDSTLSSTYKAIGTQFSSSYGSGTLYGYSGMDTVTLGELTVTNQTFGLIVSESGDWSSGGDPFDGLFGLAFTSISDMPTVTPFFQEYVYPTNPATARTYCVHDSLMSV